MNHVSMMQQPVEQSCCNHGIAEKLAPVAEVLVAGQDDAAMLVAFGDKAEEKFGLLAV